MVLAALLTAAMCYGGWEEYRWLTHAELIQIVGVDVRGVRSVSEAQVRELAGMFTGQNVFRLDLDSATRAGAGKSLGAGGQASAACRTGSV